MQDLHADLATGLMHRLSDDLMFLGFFSCGELGCPGTHRAFLVGAYPASDNQPYATASTLGEECRHPLETVGHLLQTRVHGAHQSAVAQSGETQIERSEQFRKSGHRNVLIISNAEPLGATVGMQRR